MYRTFDVPVPDGTVRVGAWGEGPEVVVAAHGLTANHLSLRPLARQLGPDVTLVAPDLRGRAGSAAVGPPFGMPAHADDLAAVLDHVGVAQAAVLLGHSMGAFVAMVAADRHPSRWGRLVLVDGGFPFPVPGSEGLSTEAIIRAVVGPALDRLRMTFPTEDAYLDFWRPHPALAADWNADIEATYVYDLVGEAPQWRSSVREEAVLEDSAGELEGPELRNALGRMSHPVVLVRAPRGLFNQEPPLYPDDVVAAGRQVVPHLEDVLVPGVNHYTVMLTDRGAAAVAAVVRSRHSQ